MYPSSSFHRGTAPVAVALLVFAARPGLAQAPAQPATRLSLAQARETAFARSPSLRVARAAVAGVRAALTTSGTYPFNPVLEGTLARRTAPDGTGTDRGLALSQEIELGGQVGKRLAAGRADLAAAEKTLLHAARLLAGQVENSYAEAVKGRELLKIDTVDVELAQTHRQHARKRLEAGAGTQIEDNLAQATLGRAERRLRSSEAAYMEARSILAEAIGLGMVVLPEPTESFPDLPPEPPPLSVLLAAAIENRADIQAFEEAKAAAQARVRLARSEALPNLVLGGFYDREGGGDKIVGVSVGIGIPIFNRNQGGIAARQAELERTAAEKASLELQLAVQLRNKGVEAYQEIFRMQV